MNQDVERNVEKLLAQYYIDHQIDIPIKVNIEFVSDLFKRRIELFMSEEDTAHIHDLKNILPNMNGLMVLPKTKHEDPYIIIVDDAIINNEYIHTLMHELTHVYDYYSYADRNNFEYFPTMMADPDTKIFSLWTEYNAYRNGIYYFKITEMENPIVKSQYTYGYILKVEIPRFTKELLINLNHYKSDNLMFNHQIIKYVSRFIVWEELFPTFITKNDIPKEVAIESLMQLHDFFLNNKSISLYLENKDQFKKIYNITNKAL